MSSMGDRAARLHRFMCEHPGFGYSWGERYGGPETVDVEGVTLNVGDYDCSSSVITVWRKLLEGTPYAGALDGATYTGNMRAVFCGSGLFEWVDVSRARPGDLYLNEASHVAMCQPGGQLSEFSINEHGGVYGGQRGDQTGWESHLAGTYSYPWDGCLHYNGKLDGAASAGNKRRRRKMECIIRPNGENYLVYFDGTEAHPLAHPDEVVAIREVYKACTGEDMPMFEYGSPDAPWATRLFEGASRRR